MTPAVTLPRGDTGAACAPVDANAARSNHPTIWGLTPLQLHDRFWASRGVQVVRPGSDAIIHPNISLFLLIENETLSLVDVPSVVGNLDGDLFYARLRNRSDELRERVVTDGVGRFLRFERIYPRPRSTFARAAFTPSAKVAAAWQAGTWKSLRRSIRRRAVECDGRQFNLSDDHQTAAFVRELIKRWPDPSQAITGATRVSENIWRDATADVHAEARLIGPVWIGRGRSADAGALVAGPTVLWDDPNSSPGGSVAACGERSRSEGTRVVFQPEAHAFGTAAKRLNVPRNRPIYHNTKRLFDIFFALIALTLTLPLYPFIILAIALNDGFPVFFRHRRETLGGREFACLKFRSMRRDAETTKSKLVSDNQADGPQFYIRRDPRLTAVGRVLRRFHIDEWPQFFNVLAGHMSVVGPRPSPFAENQFCPTWRTTRLSVRPGITGLWQIKRTRRRGTDFQEWIRYDIEYVESASWITDLQILWFTVVTMLIS